MDDKETKAEIKELGRKVDQILGYLHNNEGTGKPGLVAAFEQHKEKMDKFVSDYETKEAVKKNNMRLISFVFGLIGTGVVLLIEVVIRVV